MITKRFRAQSGDQILHLEKKTPSDGIVSECEDLDP